MITVHKAARVHIYFLSNQWPENTADFPSCNFSVKPIFLVLCFSKRQYFSGVKKLISQIFFLKFCNFFNATMCNWPFDANTYLAFYLVSIFASSISASVQSNFTKNYYQITKNDRFYYRLIQVVLGRFQVDLENRPQVGSPKIDPTDLKSTDLQDQKEYQIQKF